MEKMLIELPEINLVGITCRTNNAHIFEADPSTNPIAATVQHYFHQELSEKILYRKRPGVTYCVYADYESDYRGDYTYFIGEEVTSLEDLPEGFKAITIPPQNYVKFTNGPGPMPDVCVNMWKEIWKMTPEELGERAYIADFELYDERAADHHNVTLDIFIGVKN
jgi:predicted transcriptional regulator YdeE